MIGKNYGRHNDDDVLEIIREEHVHSTEKLEESFELLRHVKSSDRSCYEGNSVLRKRSSGEEGSTRFLLVASQLHVQVNARMT